MQCDGCCRFKAADSPWRPKLGAEEAKGLAARITQAGWLDDDGHIHTLRHCGQDLCRFFDPADHTCKVYGDPNALNWDRFIEVEKKTREIAKRNNIKVFGSYDPKQNNLKEDDFYDFQHVKPKGFDKIDYSH